MLQVVRFRVPQARRQHLTPLARLARAGLRAVATACRVTTSLFPTDACTLYEAASGSTTSGLLRSFCHFYCAALAFGRTAACTSIAWSGESVVR